MTSITELLAEIQQRADSATPLPFKHFPMVVVGDDESQRLMNEYTQLGMRYTTDIPALLAVIEKLIEQREVYAERAGDQENYESDNDELAQLLEERTK